jgi:hypothetical protein
VNGGAEPIALYPVCMKVISIIDAISAGEE